MFHFFSGMGCFWGAERRFWRIPGVFSTQVGYAGGYTPNPTYQEVCSGESPPHTHTQPIRRGSSPLDKWLTTYILIHLNTLSNTFTVPKLMLCRSLYQNIPFICSELPRMHYSLLDPQPLPLLLCDLLVTRKFIRDDMEGGMEL